ncbi:hypothetical protein FKR81_03190 [Lentzea tibetensis]|uniref:Uncharacterized protein n=1 Tax=Lentzea tibetensis TaxID=2591470 RepID=A0A563F350_9PSEU|nr:hypothetical protein [Lentzea tibetensis]TWP53774.1 hypothetical protein FKR81_03190 [Lentzea tibetensis]
MTDLNRRAVIRGGAALALLTTFSGGLPTWASGRIGPDTPVRPPDFDSPVWRALPLPDRQLFTILSQIHSTFSEHSGQIWNGYRPDRGPMICGHFPGADAPVDYAYVLNSRDPAKVGDAQPVDLPRALCLPRVHRITRGPGVEAAQDPGGTVGAREVAGELTWLVGFSTAVGWVLDPSTWLFGRIAVHEAFHVHQAGWDHGDGVQYWPNDYPRDVENAALALLEDAVLTLPPGQRPSTARTALLTYLAIRATRHDRLPETRKREHMYHLIEGTARFVEERYVRLGGHGPLDRSLDLTVGKLLLVWIARSRGYRAGADCAELLDSAAGPGWRLRAPQGKAPADVAGEVLGVPGGEERDRLVAKAKADFDYAKLLAKVERADLPHAVYP